MRKAFNSVSHNQLLTDMALHIFTWKYNKFLDIYGVILSKQLHTYYWMILSNPYLLRGTLSIVLSKLLLIYSGVVLSKHQHITIPKQWWSCDPTKFCDLQVYQSWYVVIATSSDATELIIYMLARVDHNQWWIQRPFPFFHFLGQKQSTYSNRASISLIKRHSGSVAWQLHI